MEGRTCQKTELNPCRLLRISRAERYDSAVYWLDKVWQMDTLDSRVQFSLGASLERSGQFDRAVSVFKSMIAREPENGIALNYLGYMYADSGIHDGEMQHIVSVALSISMRDRRGKSSRHRDRSDAGEL